MRFLEMLSLLWNGTHEDFDTVLESEDGISDSEEKKLKEGDLILRPMDNKGPFYHVGVYCGESEVIDFVGQPDSSQEQNQGSISSLSCTYSSLIMNGEVRKLGVKIFLRNKMCRVLRLRFSIPKGFRERVKKAMNNALQYSASNFNCLHFALELLGKKQLLDKEKVAETMPLQDMKFKRN